MEANRPSTFTFNFEIPAEDEDTPKKEINANFPEDIKTEKSSGAADAAAGDQNKGSEIESQPSKKKKKKKKEKPKQQDGSRVESVQTQASDEQTVQLSSEQQLSRELDWCIEQLELGLKTQKSTAKQVEEATRALKTLHSNKAPLVKKRQVMRNMLGDYRKKMEDERQKQLRIMQAATKSAQITAVSKQKKSQVLCTMAQRKIPTSTNKSLVPEAQNPGTQTFVFTPVQEEFRFNFF
ncbi:UPF0488 protein C8orf33 homolog [Erpetoichthys calabaricus]|uniref:Zgc:112185 n=1 Tax=Erpetoichthys calabaricus TaxID=27687 RepID=A0A8C4SYI4_ERPCA|nr:UPF0488 protein C8orf33 homolog [Erpetoichthys calabaricus]